MAETKAPARMALALEWDTPLSGSCKYNRAQGAPVMKRPNFGWMILSMCRPSSAA
jgi:hypothetical protein